MAIRHVINGFAFEVRRDGTLDVEDEEEAAFRFTPEMLTAFRIFLRAPGVQALIAAAERGREKASEVEE